MATTIRSEAAIAGTLLGAIVFGAMVMRPRREDVALRASMERLRLFPRQRSETREEIGADDPGFAIVRLYSQGPMVESVASDLGTARLRARELRKEVLACGRSDFEEVSTNKSGRVLIRLGDRDAFSVSGRTLQEALSKIDEERALVAEGKGKGAMLKKLRGKK